jgi:hypothetical protein
MAGIFRFPSQIEDGIIALRRFMKGEPVTGRRRDDLDYLTQQLRLPKPIETYAPRTQRRFVAGARKSRTRTEINRAERAAYQSNRATFTASHGGLTATQWRTIRRLADRVTTLGVDVAPYMDDAVLVDFATMYGHTYLHTVLTNQIDSTEHYLRGDRTPGRARWDARGELEQQFAASVHIIHASGSDPYYYYHGRH